jgi:TRAP-type mannitol/chloroaromatic compound transport system substrate-binding protein
MGVAEHKLQPPRPTREESMKRRDFLKSASIATAASALAAPAIAQSMPEVRWRMALSWPKSLDTLYGACEQLAKRVGELTDNRFQIQLFAAGEIVPGLQVLDAVQAGTVEIGNTAGYYYWGKDPAFAFSTAIPFGFNTRQAEAWLYHGGGHDLLNELYAQYNCYGIASGNTGAQMGGWYRKEIATVDDFKGLKMRIGGFAGRVISKLGVIPQQLAPGDIYPALEKGTIDAVEWVGPYDDEKLGFVKVAKYYYSPGWWEGCANGVTLINLPKWQSLPPIYKAVLTAAAHEASLWLTSKYDLVNPPAIRRLVAAGAQLRTFSQEQLEAAYKAANDTYAEISQTNARFKKLLDSLTAFRNDSYQWWQVCELPFDTFQVRMRAKI